MTLVESPSQEGKINRRSYLLDPRDDATLIAASVDGTVANWDLDRKEIIQGSRFPQTLLTVRVEGVLQGFAMGLGKGTTQVVDFLEEPP